MNDLSQKRELYDEAKALYDSKAFKTALANLQGAWLAELINAADTTERKLEIVAKMKALDGVVGELKRLMNDFTMAARRQGAAHG